MAGVNGRQDVSEVPQLLWLLLMTMFFLPKVFLSIN
jgi:hypothetical protein